MPWQAILGGASGGAAVAIVVAVFFLKSVAGSPKPPLLGWGFWQGAQVSRFSRPGTVKARASGALRTLWLLQS